MKKRLFGIVAMVVSLLIALNISVFAEEPKEYPKFEGELSISDKGIELIKSLEGCINRPMSDYGQYSIGYGCSTEFAQEHGFSTTYLNEEAAHELLLFVIDGMEDKLDTFLAQYNIQVNQNQYDALVSFTYNLGSSWMNSSSRLGQVLIEGDYTVNEFASAMGVYCHVTTKDGSKILDLLVDRRIREIKLFLYGAYNLNDVEQKFCTLKFDAQDGKVAADIGFYLVGQPFQLLFNATSDYGLYHVGWIDENGNSITAETIATGSATLTAAWDMFEAEDAGLYIEGETYVSDLSVRPQKRSFGKDEGGVGEVPSDPPVDVPTDIPVTPPSTGDGETGDVEVGIEASSVFSDLGQEQWYYKYVNDLYNALVINGYEDGTFRPLRTVSNGEALKMILLAAGYAEPDTTEGHWANGYFNFALEQGFIDAADIADLDAAISRVLIAKITAKAMGLERLFDTEPFVDTSNVYAAILSDHGIVEGYEDRTFRERGLLTRAELSAIVWRINNYY